jgi:hypothetical protein
MRVDKDKWGFCKAIGCEHFRMLLPENKRCSVKLDPFDCEECMDEKEPEMYRKYLNGGEN